jgi:hypothetical protein
MITIPFTLDKYEEWDSFCEESDDAWFWHTTGWLKYSLGYKPEIKKDILSFLVFHDKVLLAICPLVLETKDGIAQFSQAQSYGESPALKNGIAKSLKSELWKVIFGHIDELAKEYKVKRILIRLPVLASSKVLSNILVKFGYLDTSTNTQVIDMRKSFLEIKKDIRNGHISDIKKIEKTLTADIFDKSSITKKIFEKYIDLHFKAAGRATRPRSTFDMMFDFIKEGKGFLIGAKKGKEYVGFSYFYLYKGSVYYGSSCNDPEFGNIPIGHFIQWNALVWMHKNKCILYEIGGQSYGPTLLETPSPKEINISQFKRGFGGSTCTLFRGEKYYDKKYFLDVYTKRIQEFAKNI